MLVARLSLFEGVVCKRPKGTEPRGHGRRPRRFSAPAARFVSTRLIPAADAHGDYIAITSPLHFGRRRSVRPDAEHKNPAISGRAPPRQRIRSSSAEWVRPSTSGERGHLFTARPVFS